MSASLVGSEMCIRDRPPIASHGSGSDNHGRAKDRGYTRNGRHVHKKQSVSYTHLTLPTICSV
eukprot:5836425-Alexandrium_andersonii.AAC.1